MPNTLRPLEPPFSDAVSKTLKVYPQQDGYILSLFRTFANSLRFLKKGVPNLLDRESPLSLRVREIVILRVTAHYECEYEWGVHAAVFAKAAKLSDEQVQATLRRDASSSCWSGEERCLISAVDELCTNGRLTPENQARFEADLNLEQQLEVMALCGTYHTISLVANVAQLPGEAFGARFPA